jgi:1,4-dihydroxy-2-naphthoate octaprenyltransferase
MAQIRYWIKAFRLRTLPLALSTVWMGSLAAAIFGGFNFEVCVWATVTTLCLQILSNLANDYGDAASGADKTRIGPARMVQSGHITPKQMLAMMVVFALLSLVAGITLLWLAFPSFFSWQGLLFFVLGVLAIGASVNYTVGKNPYGYKGWGDVFVFVFFGLLGVFGTFFLHTHVWEPLVFLPAITIGCLSVGVLNVNNLRDSENDARTGKRSLVVIFGTRFGIRFQITLVFMAILSLMVFTHFSTTGLFPWFFVLAFPLLALHIYRIVSAKSSMDYDPELKRLSLTTFALVMLFAIGHLINIA